jgi:hypothetical protein
MMKAFKVLLIIVCIEFCFSQSNKFCPSGQTDCIVDITTIGCCIKYSDGVCCDDKLHCCPAKHSCDIINNVCKPPPLPDDPYLMFLQIETPLSKISFEERGKREDIIKCIQDLSPFITDLERVYDDIKQGSKKSELIEAVQALLSSTKQLASNCIKIFKEFLQ